MTKFAKPGQSEDYHVMASKAARAALEDAKVPYDDVEQAYAGYVYGDSTCGQRAVYEVGLTGIPVFNVNNNCSTGSTALMLGKQAIEGGIAECVLVVGFEKMEKGALGSKFTDRESPIEQARQGDARRAGLQPGAARRRRCSAARAREYRWKYGAKKETFAQGQREGAQARGEQPVRDLQPAADAGGGHAERGGLRPAHPLPVLPADVRRRRGHPVLGRLREEARASRTRCGSPRRR